MIFVVLFFIVVTVVAYIFRDKPKSQENSQSGASTQRGEDMAEGPVCGTFVSPSEGVIYRGVCYCSKACFCSKECFKKGK